MESTLEEIGPSLETNCPLDTPESQSAMEEYTETEEPQPNGDSENNEWPVRNHLRRLLHKRKQKAKGLPIRKWLLIRSFQRMRSQRVMELFQSPKSIIEQLVKCQEDYENPAILNLNSTLTFPLTDSVEDRSLHIVEITTVTTRLGSEFAQKVPCFDMFPRQDRVILLRGCFSIVMILKLARKYDVATDCIVFENDERYTREAFSTALMNDSADAVFDFCRDVCNLKLDDAEYALLTVIYIMSERPDLLETGLLREIRGLYINTLQNYVSTNRSAGEHFFGSLLSILSELYDLEEYSSRFKVNIQLRDNRLPPILEELWCIKPPYSVDVLREFMGPGPAL